jgi:hypothetical protein
VSAAIVLAVIARIEVTEQSSFFGEAMDRRRVTRHRARIRAPR